MVLTTPSSRRQLKTKCKSSMTNLPTSKVLKSNTFSVHFAEFLKRENELMKRECDYKTVAIMGC
jgi:hypothetical protein